MSFIDRIRMGWMSIPAGWRGLIVKSTFSSIAFFFAQLVLVGEGNILAMIPGVMYAAFSMFAKMLAGGPAISGAPGAAKNVSVVHDAVGHL